MTGTGIRLYAKEQLSLLPQAQLDGYERAVCIEAARLWSEFERTPCDLNLGSWRGFVSAWVEPVVSEQSWRIIRQAVTRNGAGGVAI